jgi:hypothetical protein
MKKKIQKFAFWLLRVTNYKENKPKKVKPDWISIQPVGLGEKKSYDIVLKSEKGTGEYIGRISHCHYVRKSELKDSNNPNTVAIDIPIEKTMKRLKEVLDKN